MVICFDAGTRQLGSCGEKLINLSSCTKSIHFRERVLGLGPKEKRHVALNKIDCSSHFSLFTLHNAALGIIAGVNLPRNG